MGLVKCRLNKDRFFFSSASSRAEETLLVYYSTWRFTSEPASMEASLSCCFGLFILYPQYILLLCYHIVQKIYGSLYNNKYSKMGVLDEVMFSHLQ